MIPILFINCDLFPFIDWIMDYLKLDETRTRNMLRALVGQRVLLAETRRGRRPLVRCSCVIGDPVAVRSREEWDRLRHLHYIPAGCRYDWQPGTKVKYLYPITDIIPCDPFTPPEGIRHGRVWMEYTPGKEAKA